MKIYFTRIKIKPYLLFAYLFKFVSFLLTIYFTCHELNRFTLNKDVSTVNVKKFLVRNEKHNEYPTFSICLDGMTYDELYNETYLLQKGLTLDSIIKYPNMLRGKEVNETILSLAKPEKAMKNLKHIICYFYAKSRTGIVIDNWLKDMSCSWKDWLLTGKGRKTLPFYISYRSPDKMCFTPTSSNEEHKRKEDILKLDLQWMTSPSEGALSTVVMEIYIHGKGQLIRNFGKEIHNVQMFDLYPYPKEKLIKNEIELSVSYVSVIKKRKDANIPCHSEELGDDWYIRQKIVDEVGCIPPYWIDFHTKSDKIMICNSSKQLGSAYKYLADMERTLDKSLEPCTEMTIVSSIQFGSTTIESHKRRFEMTLKYLTESYQEIANQKEFSANALWSSIGGFVGIFIGYSMMQIPDTFLVLKRKWEVHK